MKKKVAAIIACQILLISSSYLIMVFFVNQSTYLGNTINTSGKNRFLGELLYQETINYVLENKKNPPLDIISNIDNNIKTLSHGGEISVNASLAPQSEITIMPVPSQFSEDLESLTDNWNAYRQDVMTEIGSQADKNILGDQGLENHKVVFITSADKITSNLAEYSKGLVSDMIILQVALLGINVVVHLFLLRIILRLIREEQTGKVLLQDMSDKNKKLEFETKFALIQKDISQAFILDMEDKLHALNEQVNLIKERKDYEKNSKIIQELFQSLFSKIHKLAQSTIEFENKAADYEQLLTKLRRTISVLSDNNKSYNVKKPEDLVTLILSYIDLVNIMIHDQVIPAKLGRDLIDTLHDVVDHLTLKTKT